MNGPGYLAVAIETGPNTDESAFHDWYNTEHGPLRLRLPFITTGDRYKASDSKQPGWSAVYDVTDLANLEKRIYSRMREERSKREKQVMGTFTSLDRKIYAQTSTRQKAGYSGPAPVQVVVTAVLKDEDLGDSDQWYEEEHIGMLAKIPGWLRSRRFRLVAPGLKGMPPTGQTETLAVHDFEAKNGLGGAEDDAAKATPGFARILQKGVGGEIRLWSHYHAFDALREPPSSVITTDGAELKFQMEGNPADPVIVCVNSILTNFSIWDRVAADLAKGINGKTFRVLRYNSRGYLQQDPKSNDTRFDLLADDLEYLLDRLNVSKAHAVLGVSMGGVTAINFAIRYPSRLEKFIACDCNVAASPANNQAWADRIELTKNKGMPALAKATVERWFTPANHGSEAFDKVVEMVKPANVAGFEQSAGALCNYDLKDNLSKITTPGLLIAGEGDGKLPEAMQKFGIPGTKFVSIPKAGHLPMLENHEAFIGAVASFL